MSDKDPEQLAREVYRHELKAGEKMTELFEVNDPQDGEEAMLKVFNELADNIEDDQRLKKLVILLDNFGRSLGSQSLVERATKEARENDNLVMKEDI